MKKNIRSIALVLALAFTVQGCYGSFALTRKLWKWNGDLGNKWASEGVFLIIGAILPVYGICTFVDSLILNSVEFWSGKNPMALKTVTDGDKMAVMKNEGNNTVRISFFEKSRPTGTLVLVKKGEQIFAKNAQGELQAVATSDNGFVTLADAKGAVLANSVVR